MYEKIQLSYEKAKVETTKTGWNLVGENVPGYELFWNENTGEIISLSDPAEFNKLKNQVKND